MRAVNIPIMVLLVAAALGGCGQKGSLYQGNPDMSSESPAQPVSAKAQTERSGDRSSDTH